MSKTHDGRWLAVWTMHWMCLRALALLKCIISGSHAFISGRNPAGVDRHWGYDIYNLWFRELFQTYRTWFPFDLTGMSCPVSVQTLDIRRKASTIQVLLKSLREIMRYGRAESTSSDCICVFLASGLTACRCSAGWRVSVWWPKAFWSKGTWTWSWCSCARRSPPNCCCTPSAPTCRCRSR